MEAKAGGYNSAGSTLKSSLSDVTLMLLGKTGAGKSSLGNAILNLSGKLAFSVTDGLCATPIYEAVAKKAYVHDRVVKVVDTPGVMDTNADSGGGEERALQGICQGISCCHEGVDAFLIVLRLDMRLTKEEFKSIAKLEQLFGQKFWSHVILVFTRGDSVQNEAKKFEQILAAAKDGMPQLGQLISKLRTTPQMVDASVGRQSKVADKHIIGLISAVDMLVSANKRKYTNELFAIARAELATKENDELKKKRKEANLQLTLLMNEVSNLKSQREEDKRKLEALERRAREAEMKLEASKRRAVEQTQEVGRKKCVIL